MSKAKSIVGVTAAAVAAGTAYGLYQRPRMATWGATQAETLERLPGDEIVADPKYGTTHAVTIDAPIENVWPWLVQMGQGRGGLYSYDRLENLVGLGIHSLDRIDPTLQQLAVGDVIRLVPESVEPPLQFVVSRIEAPHLLVLGPPASREETLAAALPYPTWTFRLSEVDEGTTRMVVRFRSDFKPGAASSLMNKYALEPVHFLMERKMLLGIKERAEHAA